MGMLIKNGSPIGGSSNNANAIKYDNSSSGLSAGNVQAAIDEVSSKKPLSLSFKSTYNVSIASKNALFEQNGFYYIDVLISIGVAVPSTETSFITILDSNGDSITFSKRVDAVLIGSVTKFIIGTADSSTINPNSVEIPAGVYKLTMIYSP